MVWWSSAKVDGRRGFELDWTEYRERAANVDPTRDLFGRPRPATPKWGPLRCPRCDGPCLGAVTTTLYPCEPCGWGWYPADLDFNDPRRKPEAPS